MSAETTEAPVKKNAVSRAAERKSAAALQLRKSGSDWDEVAELTGFASARAAQTAVERHLESQIRNDPSIKGVMRQLADVRLDRLLRAVWPKAINPDSPEQMIAVAKAREIIADHRKLHGLDAPTEISVHNPTSQEIEAWVAANTAHLRVEVVEDDILDAEYEDDPLEEEVLALEAKRQAEKETEE